ncbi:MAG: enoyl-CoA hydratase/isomerase family protein [Nakamurella sp.]
MAELERVDREHVAWLQLSRPARGNALTTHLLESLREQLRSIAEGRGIKVVVLSGAGDVFCSGADLAEFKSGLDPQGSLNRVRLVSEILTQIRRLEQPTIAAVNGAAIGAGWGLAMVCDLCFTVVDAKFCIPEIAKGFRLPGIIVRRLVGVVGSTRAAEIVMGGASYDAERAVDWGWASRIFGDRSALSDGTWQVATEWASRPRRALAAAVTPLRQGPDRDPSPLPEYVWDEE